MRIDWWSLALQAANFLVLVWLLQHFLYRPVQGIIAERQQRAESVLAEASSARAAAEELRAQLGEQWAAIESERHRVLEEAHAKAKEEAAALLERARVDAEKLLGEERERLAQERAEAADALRLRAVELGVAIGRRLLAETGDSRLDQTFLIRALARLEALNEEGRAALIDRLKGDDVVVDVITAAPLDAADRDDATERLRALLSAPIKVRFAEDPALLAGAELHFPHSVLHDSWRESLREIEEDLKRDGRPAGLA
jgi:F-type H+-transporting ATPase subunit b